MPCQLLPSPGVIQVWMPDIPDHSKSNRPITSPSQPMGSRVGTPAVGVGVMVGVRVSVAVASGVGLAEGVAVVVGVSEAGGWACQSGSGWAALWASEWAYRSVLGWACRSVLGWLDPVGVGVGVSMGASVGVSVGAGISVINCSDSELACPTGTARKASQIPARESARTAFGRRALRSGGITPFTPLVRFDPKNKPTIRTALEARPSGRVRYWLLARLADGHDRPATSSPAIHSLHVGGRVSGIC